MKLKALRTSLTHTLVNRAKRNDQPAIVVAPTAAEGRRPRYQGGRQTKLNMGSLLPDGFLRAAPADLLDAEETRYERDLKTALEESMRVDEVERDPDVYLAVQAMARMEAGEEDTDIEVVDEDDAASAASLRSDIESAVAVLADEQVRSAARLAELETKLRESSSSSRSSTKLREGHTEASEEAAMLARRRDRLERAASELDAMEVALNGSDAPPEERRALREIILHSLLTDLENSGESNAKPKPKPPSEHDTKDKAPATATGGGIVSRLLGRRKIAVVEDDEESTFANPNDLGRASGLSDDFSVLDDDPNDLARMSGMSELARASGSLELTRGPRGVDEMELLLGDIKKMAAKMRSKNQRRKDDTDEDSDSPSVVRSELALFDDLRHTLLDRDDTNKRKPPPTASSHELTRTSSGLGRLERERKAFGPLLRDLAEEVRDARPADPEALREFLDKIDEVLASLTEPHVILREIPEWPGAKVEAMRELRDLQTELREMAGAMNEWPALDPNSRALRRTAKASAVMWACDEELGKIARAMDAAARRLESITRRLESDGKRFAAHGLTFDEADVEKTRHASLTLAERHMRCASLAADRAMDDGDADGVGKARELLAGAVRFAFRSHELAGGFNGGCRDALEDVRNALNSLPDRR